MKPLFIKIFDLKKKLKENGYNKSEIKSIIKQIRKFDSDLKKCIYNWVYNDYIPDDNENPLFVIENQSLFEICKQANITLPAAVAILQAYRRNRADGLEMLSDAMADTGFPDLSEEEVNYLNEKYKLSDKKDDNADDSDIII